MSFHPAASEPVQRGSHGETTASAVTCAASLRGTTSRVSSGVVLRLQVDPALGMGLGTPAAAALMPGGAAAGDGLPTVARMFNLYQPYDPVAYRRAACPTCAQWICGMSVLDMAFMLGSQAAAVLATGRALRLLLCAPCATAHWQRPSERRMEPLVTTGAEKHRPVFAAFHRGGRRIHIGLQACPVQSVAALS